MPIEWTHDENEDAEKERLAAMTKADLVIENKELRDRLHDMEAMMQGLIDSKARMFNDCCLDKGYQKGGE